MGSGALVVRVEQLERNALLLIGGDKTGDDRFYERMIPHAERIFAEYLQETAEANGRRRVTSSLRSKRRRTALGSSASCSK
jgi:hypothetical protein